MMYKNNTQYDVHIGGTTSVIRHTSFPIFVEYIENTNKNWFSIPIYQSLGTDYIIDMKISITHSIESTAWFVGHYSGLGFAVKNRGVLSAGGYIYKIPVMLNHIYDVSLYRNSDLYRCCKFGNYEIIGSVSSNIVNQLTIFHQSQYSGYYMGKVFYIKVRRNGNVISELRPCLSVESGHLNEPALYDCVEDKYYYNQGSGTFAVGNRI